MLNYRNLPDSLLLGDQSNVQIEAKLRTSGFQFLYYKIFKGRMDIDVSQVAYQNGKYVLGQEALRRQMDQQLSQNVSLLELDRQVLEVDLYQVETKKNTRSTQNEPSVGAEFYFGGKSRGKP